MNSQLCHLHHTITIIPKLMRNLLNLFEHSITHGCFMIHFYDFSLQLYYDVDERADYLYLFLDVLSFMVLFISWINISHYFSKVCWSQQVFILVTFLWVISWLFVYVYVSLYYVIIQILGWSKVMKGIFYGEDFLKFRIYLQQLVPKIPTVV